MSLDFDLLEKPRLCAGKLIARCPACAEMSEDRSCEHLFIADEGRGPFGCIAHAGPAGEVHRKRIWELAGKAAKPGQPRPLPLPHPKPTPKPAPRIPPLRRLNVAEMAAVAHLRGWSSFAGLELLTQRGLLWRGDVFDDGREWPAWIITDSTRRNTQARRLEGGLWHGIGGKKAKSLPGSDPAWPIGAPEIGNRPLVLLCEGQPDFCAALFVAWWEAGNTDGVAPVCMTGAGNLIHADALPLFAGRRVRIAVHADPQGRGAGERWAHQIYCAGATTVDGFHFDGLAKRDGKSVEDLADFAELLNADDPPTACLLEDFAVNANNRKGNQP